MTKQIPSILLTLGIALDALAQSASTPVAIAIEASPPDAGIVTGAGSYAKGASVTATATATNGCFYFVKWTAAGKTVSADPTYVFSAGTKETLIADFAQSSYKIQTASAPANGGTTSGGGTKECGSVAKLTARANLGFRFANWTENGQIDATNSSYSFDVSDAALLTANFVSTQPPTLTLTSPTGNETTTENTLTLTGTTKDNAPVTNVYCTVSGSAAIPARTANGWTNWSATVPLAVGTNVIQIVAQANSGLNSAAKTLLILREAAPPSVSAFSIDDTDTITHPEVQIAFDGVNYLAAFSIESSGSGTPSGQFISQSGQLVGSSFPLNPSQAGGDPPWVAFDGANYLTAWYADEGNGETVVLGAFVSPDGTVGSAEQLTQSTTVEDFASIAFGGGVYFIMWSDSRGASSSAIRGAMIDTSGNQAVSDFVISPSGIQNEAGQSSPAAFDGANFLAVWSGASGGTSIEGRLISPTGEFATDPFVIFENSAHLGLALNSVVFDGTKYMVLFTAETASGSYAGARSYGRFVTPSGEVLPNQIDFTQSTTPQLFPCAAFDGGQYLVVWNQGFNLSTTATSGQITGQLFDSEGGPVTAAFPILGPQGRQIPLVATALFDGTKFFVAGGLGRFASAAPKITFTDAIISGAFVSP